MAGSVRWGLGVLSALGMIWAPRAQAGVIESVVLDWHQHIEKCEADEGWLDRGAAVHVAMFDAVNAIAGRYQPYSAGLNAAPDSDMTVAAATAAHDVLVALCPGEAEVFEGALKKTVDAVASKTARDGGAEIGRRAAAAVLAARKDAGDVDLPAGDATFRSDDDKWPAIGRQLVVAEIGISWPHDGDE